MQCVQVQLEAEGQKMVAEVRRQQTVLWRANTDVNRTVQALYTAEVTLEAAKVMPSSECPLRSCGPMDFG